MTRVSVIIPVWNGRRYLDACLNAVLAQQDVDVAVIAVDNGSTDGSAEFIQDRYPQVHVLRNDYNAGFAGACNRGIVASEGDVVVLLNQDTRVRPGWLTAMEQAFTTPHVGIVGCKILYPETETIQHAGGWIEWPLGLAHHYGRGEDDTGQWNAPRSVEYVTGAAMGIRREVIDEVGLLDDGFRPGYFEDADYCLRAGAAGYDVWYTPDALVEHAETTSLTEAAAISLAYQRGRLRLVLKHLPPQQILEAFVPAEKAFQRPAIRGRESRALRLAYVEAIPMAARILRDRWDADAATVGAVLEALRALHQGAWHEAWEKETERIAGAVPMPIRHAGEDFPPAFEEFRFSSNVPLLGPLVARIRSLWYSVAARWAVRYLAQQQELINTRIVRTMEMQQQMMMMLVEENARLAEAVVQATMDRDTGGES